MPELNFKALNDILLSRADSFLSDLFPNGKKEGNEYKIGNLSGDAGGSLSINLTTGIWKDFASSDGGGDLISLYAKAKGLTNGEAYKQLGGKQPKKPDLKVIDKNKYDYGDGLIVHRTVFDDYSKSFKIQNTKTNTWGWPDKNNRPLYNLKDLDLNRNIIIVEGEKCVDFLKSVQTKYSVLTWSGGTNNVNNTNWTPLKETTQSIFIWPDCDEPGLKAAAQIKTQLIKLGLTNVIVLDPRKKNILPDVKGWDVVDAWPLFENYQGFVKWAREVKVENLELPPEPEKKPKNEITTSPNKQSETKLTNYNLPTMSDLEDLGVQQTKAGFVCNEYNVALVLKNLFNDRIYYDSFSEEIMHVDLLTGKETKARDGSELSLLSDFQKIGFTKLNSTTLRNALKILGEINARSSTVEWLKNLKWDGQGRLSAFHNHYAKAGKDYATDYYITYRQALGINLFVAMVARMLEPGCKFDNMFIWEGKEGILKSTALKVIGGRYYTSQAQQCGTKDFDVAVKGYCLVELQELCGFSKLDEVMQKAFLSTEVSRFRGAYEKNAGDILRTSVFVGTTNRQKYIKQGNGARRLWPIWIDSIDLDAIKQDREQLFAEAVALYNQGYQFYEVPKKIHDEIMRTKNPTLYEHEESIDIREEIINKFIWSIPESSRGCFTISWVYNYALNGKNDSASRIPKTLSNDISKILRNLGFTTKRITRGGPYLWVNPQYTTNEHEITLTNLPDSKSSYPQSNSLYL